MTETDIFYNMTYRYHGYSGRLVPEVENRRQKPPNNKEFHPERNTVGMKYEIVYLEEKTAVGISARTNNTDPDMGAVIGGLWKRFYSEGIYARIPDKVNAKALGIYTDYAGDEKSDYTTVVACETSAEPDGKEFCICKIPAGPYAKFVIHGDMVQAVGAAWQEIWQMNLPRTFQCDFEEYQDDSMDHAEIHIYVGLKAGE